jgi:hypothetical protein
MLASSKTISLKGFIFYSHDNKTFTALYFTHIIPDLYLQSTYKHFNASCIGKEQIKEVSGGNPWPDNGRIIGGSTRTGVQHTPEEKNWTFDDWVPDSLLRRSVGNP